MKIVEHPTRDLKIPACNMQCYTSVFQALPTYRRLSNIEAYYKVEPVTPLEN